MLQTLAAAVKCIIHRSPLHAGAAAVNAAEIPVLARALNVIYANRTQPNLLGLEDANALPYMKVKLQTAVTTFLNMHKGKAC